MNTRITEVLLHPHTAIHESEPSEFVRAITSPDGGETIRQQIGRVASRLSTPSKSPEHAQTLDDVLGIPDETETNNFIRSITQ